MKIRKGYVSNSSSSSFICDVCGSDVSGWDMSLTEAEMYECENGHVFCEEHLIELDSQKEIAIELVKKSLKKSQTYQEKYGDYEENIEKETKLLEELESSDEEDYDYDQVLDDYEFRYGVPAKCCPICQMEHVTDKDMIAFLLKKNNITSEDVKKEIKSTFPTYDDLLNYFK